MTAQVEPGIEHTQSEYIFPGRSGGGDTCAVDFGLPE